MVISALEKQDVSEINVGDTISRQAAIDAINSHFGFNIEEEYGSAVQEVINGLPSAQPERKVGKWIPQDYNQRYGNISTAVYYYPKCSVCGCSGDYTDAFCKSCGADMRGEQDGVD